MTRKKKKGQDHKQMMCRGQEPPNPNLLTLKKKLQLEINKTRVSNPQILKYKYKINWGWQIV